MKMLIKALTGLALSFALAQPCLAQSSTGLFQQRGTGAVTRTMQDKARELVSGADFSGNLTNALAASQAKTPDNFYYNGSLELTTGMFTQPATGTFYNPGAKINLFADRSFFGPAVLQGGLDFPAVGNDWLGQLTNVSYNGGDGVTQNGRYAQNYFLTDPNSTPCVAAAPCQAAIFGAETINGLDGSTTYPIGTVVVNNSTTHATSAWGAYIEAHHVGSAASHTWGAEIEMRNSVAFRYWDPYTSPSAGTVGLSFGAGAGLSSTGQFDATAAIRVGPNPMAFGAGRDVHCLGLFDNAAYDT